MAPCHSEAWISRSLRHILGLGGELGVVIAGSRNLAFPAETERLLLDVAATEAAIAVRQVRLLSQQRRALRNSMSASQTDE